MGLRKNQSIRKAESLVSKFIIENDARDKDEFTNTVTFATQEEIDKFRLPTAKDYFDQIHKRTTKIISKSKIVIDEKQDRLNIIFRNSLNIRDVGNPMFFEENNLNRKNFSTNIIKAGREKNKVCVIYGGDLFGNEWLIKYLNNAPILKDDVPLEEGQKLSDVILWDDKKKRFEYKGEYYLKGNVIYDARKKDLTIRRALYYGLKDRKNELKKDITFALSHGVDVYLCDGLQEHKINQYFKINVLSDIVKEMKKPHLYYIPGVNSIINVAKKTKKGEIYATIGMQTNNSLSKAQTNQSAAQAIAKNCGLNYADVIFCTNTNIAGKIGSNIYVPSGEATYKNTPDKKFPMVSPKGANCFSLSLNGWKDISVIQGNDLPQVNFLEKEIYDEQYKNTIIKNIINEKAKQQLEEIYPQETVFESDLVKSKYFSNMSKSKKQSVKAEEESKNEIEEFKKECKKEVEEFKKECKKEIDEIEEDEEGVKNGTELS